MYYVLRIAYYVLRTTYHVPGVILSGSASLPRHSAMPIVYICNHCGNDGIPCEKATMWDESCRSLCMKFQGWTKAKRKWRCPSCTKSSCMPAQPPESRPDCWEPGHLVEEAWGLVWDMAPAGRPRPTTSPPPPPPAGRPGTSTSPPPPPPPHYQGPPGGGMSPQQGTTLPTQYAELFTPEYLQAVALHKKMVNEWGSVYLEELDARFREQGVMVGLNDGVHEV